MAPGPDSMHARARAGRHLPFSPCDSSPSVLRVCVFPRTDSHAILWRVSDEAVRVDRWLWAARLFRARTDATAACDAGHVRLGDRALKPGARIRAGTELEVLNPAGRWRVRVVQATDRRVGPPLVHTVREVLEAPPPPERLPYNPRDEAGTSRPTRQQREALQAFRDAASFGDSAPPP